MAAIFLAHELGSIKLVEQAKASGLAAKDLSKDEELFFAYSYSYNLTYCLIRLINDQIINGQTPDISENELKYLSIISLDFFRRSDEAFSSIPRSKRRRYLIGCDKGGLQYGLPLSVNLTNPNASSFYHVGTSGSGKGNN